MDHTSKISDHLQQRLADEGMSEVSAVEAARWLDEARLLRDSPSRPGKPLRDILRKHRGMQAIAGAYQDPPQPHGRWFIRRVTASDDAPPEPQRRGGQRASSRPSANRPAHATEGPAHAIDTVEAAEAAGFSGFVSVGECIERGLPRNQPSLNQPGVYLICAPPSYLPEFIPPDEARIARNVHFPWTLARLREKWVEGVDVLYVGKSTQLRQRLRTLLRHCQGRSVNHTGGEIIWQLRGYESFLLCWRPTEPPPAPRNLETRLIQAFMRAHRGRLPFANRQT